MKLSPSWHDVFMDGDKFDRWATRFGALAVVQIASIQQLDNYGAFNIFVTVALCFACLKPLVQHIKWCCEPERDNYKYWVAGGIYIAFAVITVGAAAEYGRSLVNKTFSPAVMMIFSVILLAVACAWATLLKLKSIKNTRVNSAFSAENAEE